MNENKKGEQIAELNEEGNEALDLGLDQIIGQPDAVHPMNDVKKIRFSASFESDAVHPPNPMNVAWKKTTFLVFFVVCNFIYKLLSWFFAIPLAIVFSVQFAMVSVFSVYLFFPIGRLLAIPFGWFTSEIREQNAKLLERIAALEADKFQQLQNDQRQGRIFFSVQYSQEMCEEYWNNWQMKLDAKIAEFEGKCVPNWFMEVLAFIKREEMANSGLSTSCWTFLLFCWPKLHGNVEPHKVDYLKYGIRPNESCRMREPKLFIQKGECSEMEIPIACVPPPKYIIGFDKIYIHFLDGHFIKFIECIQSKFNGISLSLGQNQIPMWQAIEHYGQIQRLFKMLARKSSELCDIHLFNFLRSIPNAFTLIENIQTISTIILNVAEDVDLLVKWLSKSSPAVQRPKRIKYIMGKIPKSMLISKIKEQFVGSTQPANFIVPLHNVELEQPAYSIFNLENEQTGEVLALYSNTRENSSERLFLTRHPKGKEYLRDNWEEQLLSFWPPEYSTYICIDIKSIGEFF